MLKHIKVENDGSIIIPLAYINELNMRSGEKLAIRIENNELVISLDKTPSNKR